MKLNTIADDVNDAVNLGTWYIQLWLLTNKLSPLS